jgi:hypothetical protein
MQATNDGATELIDAENTKQEVQTESDEAALDFCFHCGAEVEKDCSFCESCGKSLE